MLVSKHSDQPLLAGNLPRKMPRTDPKFSANVVEVIIDVGLAAIDDDGNLPRRFASLAPLQEFLLPLGESDRLRRGVLRGVVMALVWRRTTRNRGAVVHD